MSAYETIEKAVLEKWPEHVTALQKARPTEPSQRDLQQEISTLILRLAGDDLARHVDGYRWMCRMVLEEELEFRRSGHYRLSTFAEADREVYAHAPLMTQYMDGLLLSQVLWANHISLLDYYVHDFLGPNSAAKSHLEVGPGHGLLLYLAAKATGGSVTGWDVSSTSLQRTRTMLDKLGARPGIHLEQRNLFDPEAAGGSFDSVVISEVLEHVEQPRAALDALHRSMSSGGRIFVNAPVNSPAVDHIYLFKTPEELVELVKDAGFEVESVRIAPASGFTEARARRMSVSISCGVIGRRP